MIGSRKRKRCRYRLDNYFSQYEPTPKKIKTEVSYKTKKKHNKVVCKNSSVLMANLREVRIILDRTIVDKYFQAKQMLHDILSPKPLRKAYRRNGKNKSKKQMSLLDYVQVKNDVTPNDNQIHQMKKESADVVDQNNTLSYDVNTMPQPTQIMYYMGNTCQSNCFLLDNSLVVLPRNAQFTPEEFVYNNYGFVPVMGLPQIKTEFPKDLPVKREFDDTSMNSSIVMHDHTIADIKDIAKASTPIVKANFDEQKIKPCYSYDETKFTPVQFDKDNHRPICPKCDRSFKMSEAFKQHTLLCGLEFLYECLYCEYNTKFTHAIKKHIERIHKIEMEKEGLERILIEIRKRRMDKKTLSLMSKESEVDDGAEESFVKSIESKFTPSKLTFDLFCPVCDKSFKCINGISMKMCPDCQLVTLVFKCQKCGQNFLSYNKAYRHVINKCDSLKKVSTNNNISINPTTYNCEHCDFKTWYKGAIREHIFHRHMKNDKSTFFKCDFCSFQTIYENNIKRHKRNIHGMNETIDLDD